MKQQQQQEEEVRVEVRISETAIVRPLEPPFHEDHILSLSHLDTDRNHLITVRYLRIYNDSNHQDDDIHKHPFTVISHALSAALVPYYPFSGTLLPRHSQDSRLHLHCALGDGVPLIHATLNSTILPHDPISDHLLEQLVPPSDLLRPISLQITIFNCGGFVLGASVHHAISDGLGATSFFNAIAELARQSSTNSTGITTTIHPVWERTTLLGPRRPPRVEFPFEKYLSLGGDFMEEGKRVVVKEWVNVKEEMLNGLKGLLHKQSGGLFNFTTFEALSAFIWRLRYYYLILIIFILLILH